jgi:hypothetical protein
MHHIFILGISMKFFSIFFLVTTLLTSSAFSDVRIYGVWENKDQKLRLDILDGFKAGQGPILQIKEDGSVESGSWSEKNGEIEVKLGYSSYTIAVDTDLKIFLNPSYGDGVEFTKTKPKDSSQSVTLKDNPNAFIDKLMSNQWLASKDGSTATFKPTFSSDSGVIEYSKPDGSLENLNSWATSSGVLKVGSSVIVEARASDNYFIGLDERDRFVVFRFLKKAEALVSTDITKQREEFFNQLLSGDWGTIYYGKLRTHKFRPIFGDLKGVKLTIANNRLSANKVWEYSPATGAIKVGYTEYVGALVVSGTLAFIKDNGDQEFYSRLSDSNIKRYTLGDVTELSLNEKTTTKIKKVLSSQFQRGDYFFAFEFNEDHRTGFVHQWRSEPFTITGETFKDKLIGKAEKLYRVEDFIIFEEGKVFKIDVSPSRLRPKSNEEVVQDVKSQKKLKSEALSQSLIVRILKKDGNTIDVKLPINDFSLVSNISIINE